jgi:hypothetical protein
VATRSIRSFFVVVAISHLDRPNGDTSAIKSVC